jgi:hypothetical protein
MGVNGIATGHQLAQLLQELLGLLDGLHLAVNAQATLVGVQANVQPFAYEPEMCVINAEDLRELGGILKVDLFAHCVSQAALCTSL